MILDTEKSTPIYSTGNKSINENGRPRPPPETSNATNAESPLQVTYQIMESDYAVDAHPDLSSSAHRFFVRTALRNIIFT